MGNCQVVVHGPRGEEVTIDLCNTEEQMRNMKVLQLKEKIVEKLPECAGWKHMNLTFENKLLDGDYTLLSEYGIKHMSEIRVSVLCLSGASSTPTDSCLLM